VKGGAVVVGVVADEGAPRAVCSTFLATSDEDDRLTLEPYAVGLALVSKAEAGNTEEAIEAVAVGRKRQEGLAQSGLKLLLHSLRNDGFEPLLAALLVNRAGWVSDLESYGLSSPEHAAVAEGLAVREALRKAARANEIWLEDIDEKSLRNSVAEKFNISAAAVDAVLKGAGKAMGRPWRKEQKLAFLAAWVCSKEFA
jgi:hypothetical protein